MLRHAGGHQIWVYTANNKTTGNQWKGGEEGEVVVVVAVMAMTIIQGVVNKAFLCATAARPRTRNVAGVFTG